MVDKIEIGEECSTFKIFSLTRVNTDFMHTV